MITINLSQTLLTVVFVAAAGSLLGSFVILKRMALVSDALSHVALPGVALGLLLHFNPFLGAIAFLFVAVVGIWFLEYQSSLSVDTIVGVFFTASLALGALLIPEHELIEALFGKITDLTGIETIISILASIFVIILTLFIYKRLALNMVSGEMAQSIGINNKLLEFIFLLILAVVVALGISFVGALLMGSLVIIPAASAKNIAKSLKSFMGLSVLFGVIAAFFGVYVSSIFELSPGPIFILISVGIFLISLLVRHFRA